MEIVNGSDDGELLMMGEWMDNEGLIKEWMSVGLLMGEWINGKIINATSISNKSMLLRALFTEHKWIIFNGY